MGTGPATALAALNKNTAALILLSPYTSLKNAVKSLLGSWPSMLVRERFINEEMIKKVDCPTLFIHGKEDKLIPVQHAVDLYSQCGGPSKLHMPLEMTHNFFDPACDIFYPTKDFFKINKIQTAKTKGLINILRTKWLHPPSIIRNGGCLKAVKSFQGLTVSKSGNSIFQKIKLLGSDRETSPFQSFYDKISSRTFFTSNVDSTPQQSKTEQCKTEQGTPEIFSLKRVLERLKYEDKKEEEEEKSPEVAQINDLQ